MYFPKKGGICYLLSRIRISFVFTDDFWCKVSLSTNHFVECHYINILFREILNDLPFKINNFNRTHSGKMKGYLSYMVDEMAHLLVKRQLAKWQVDKWQMKKWQFDKMASWQNCKLTKWQVDKTASWQNGKLKKWQVTEWQSDRMAIYRFFSLNCDCWENYLSLWYHKRKISEIMW